jgi:hypothetical protein
MTSDYRCLWFIDMRAMVWSGEILRFLMGDERLADKDLKLLE